MKTKVIIGSFLLMSICSFSQENSTENIDNLKNVEKITNKGKFFFIGDGAGLITLILIFTLLEIMIVMILLYAM
ncbi:hypothetical protein [Polaribacter sejongensis]|uniref:hypothetical protein n=1 Tax=Polaribacter sejongensis TaxID=985043 RepID=UPI0035A6E23E